MCYCPTPTLYLNLALTGDCAFQLSPKKPHSVWFISVLKSHLHLVIPVSYLCHYTNLCPDLSQKRAHTHTHTHTCSFLWKVGTSHRRNGFILYKLYVLLPYTYPTPKLSPHRRLCISTFPQKTSLCMIYKRFEKWGHGSMSWKVTFTL